MSFTVVIPARFASTRLPGKPLLEIGGKPMVQRVWERASESAASEVVIATDNRMVFRAAEAFGARACMTSEDHPSGTDRLQEVAEQLNLPDDHIVVNVQGDEPLVPPAVIDQVAANLAAHNAAGIATLCEPVTDREALEDPNSVKVVADGDGYALYFSRAPIPWAREHFAQPSRDLPAGSYWFRHIGLYAYRARLLHQFVRWEPAPLERVEVLEQLRALHHGVRIHVDAAVEPVPGGVDTEADLQRLRDEFGV